MIVKELITKKLLGKCLETTSRLRDELKTQFPNRKYSQEKVREVDSLLNQAGWVDANKRKILLKMYSILLDAPELNSVEQIKTEKYCVIVITNPSKNTTEYPLICTSHLELMSLSGDNCILSSCDIYRYATDDEIVRSIESLTENQLDFIYYKEEFREIITDVFSVTITDPEPIKDVTSSKDVDLTLSNGRKITVSS